LSTPATKNTSVFLPLIPATWLFTTSNEAKDRSIKKNGVALIDRLNLSQLRHFQQNTKKENE